MRDLRHLEELSSSTAFGSWANDVVLALDRVRSGNGTDEGSRAVLLQASELLSAMAQPGLRRQAPDSARSLAAGKTTRTAIGEVLGRQTPDDQKAALTALAAAAKAAAAGSLDEEQHAALDSLIELFDRLGDLQLVRSNAVLSARKRAVSWTAIQPT